MFRKLNFASATLAMVLILLLSALAQAQSKSRSPGPSGVLKPGTLQSMTTQPIRQLITGRQMAASLPAAAGQSTVITCQYGSARPGASAREVRHFWYEEAPRWLSAIPASHPIHTLVRGAVDQCPATLAAAYQTSSVAPAATERDADRVNRQVGRSPKTSAELSLPSFSAKGLNYETELTALYLGDFAHARLERDSIEFDKLFGSYLNAFARQCDAYLPRNKVEMTYQRCGTWSVTRNGYGVEISRDCVNWVTEGTGLYADPVLYAAQQRVDAEAGRNMVRDTLRGMAGSNPMGTAMRTVDAATSVGRDMDSLLKMNACASPGLKRFQDNMGRFALSEPPLHLSGGETLASIRPKTSTAGTFKDFNYTKLLDDLITENSQGWMMNRFVRGSVSGVKVSSRDELGRPSKIVGNYLFDGFNGRSKASVTVQFADGLPQCMYFSDFPTTCRSPSRRIITAYENGRYQE